jgi:hypothetical protein
VVSCFSFYFECGDFVLFCFDVLTFFRICEMGGLTIGGGLVKHEICRGNVYQPKFMVGYEGPGRMGLMK